MATSQKEQARQEKASADAEKKMDATMTDNQHIAPPEDVPEVEKGSFEKLDWRGVETYHCRLCPRDFVGPTGEADVRQHIAADHPDQVKE